MSPLLILVFASGFWSVASHFYRKDYTYVDKFDAFYKLHWGNYASNWSSAFLACNDEEADLFYPRISDEWTLVKELVEAMPSAPNVSEIFVGIHDKLGEGEFSTINGYPSSTEILNIDNSGERKCVTMDINTGVLEASQCFTESRITKPFVCKKIEDVSCPTIDKGYQYFKETRKCYKLNLKEMNWVKAMKTCLMEGAILIVPESDFEADIISKKFDIYDKTYYAGFKKLYNNEYYTVKGHKLSNTGFNRRYYDKQDECGTIRNFHHDQLYLDSDECENNHPFICEMKVFI